MTAASEAQGRGWLVDSAAVGGAPVAGAEGTGFATAAHAPSLDVTGAAGVLACLVTCPPAEVVIGGALRRV